MGRAQRERYRLSVTVGVATHDAPRRGESSLTAQHTHQGHQVDQRQRVGRASMPSFGAIKVLQQRTGADRKLCKEALEKHGDDEELAAAWVAEKTGRPDAKVEAVKAATKAAVHEVEHGPAPSGSNDVSIINMEVGDGETFPAYGDTLHIHYRGMLEDGTEFDSSYSRNAPFTFRFGMGKVIKGWDMALAKMSVGEKALVLVPSGLAYGAAGHGKVIPPHADLKFEVKFVDLTRQTSCLGPGQHGGVQRKNHEYAQLADQLLGRAPADGLEQRLPDDRQLMPLTSDMPH